LKPAGASAAFVWGLFAVLLALAAVPVLSTALPPLFDYPNHLARMHLLTEGGDAPIWHCRAECYSRRGLIIDYRRPGFCCWLRRRTAPGQTGAVQQQHRARPPK